MMPADVSVSRFDLSFLTQVARVALVVAVLAAAIGYAIGGDAGFGIACIVVAAADISLVFAAVWRAQRALDAELADPVPSVLMVAGRLVVKGGLLVIAALLHRDAVFWGAVTGAVSFEVTLAVAGSVMAVSRVRKHTVEGR